MPVQEVVYQKPDGSFDAKKILSAMINLKSEAADIRQDLKDLKAMILKSGYTKKQLALALKFVPEDDDERNEDLTGASNLLQEMGHAPIAINY